MFKRALALVMSLVMLVLAIPFTSFAKENKQEVIAEQTKVKTQEDIEINTAEDTLNYDQSWEEEYPNGTFAFASMSGTIAEGTDDSKSSLRIPVYRLGGIDGVATAVIRYTPMIATLDDGSASYAFAISAKKDIKLLHEDANPISENQPIAYPNMDPAPDDVCIGMQEYIPEEGVDVPEDANIVNLALSFSENEPECLEYIWQYKYFDEDNRNWRSIDNSDTPDFQVNLNDILDENGNPLFDYRVIYKTEDGYFCSPTVFTEEEYVPELDDSENLSIIENNEERTFTEYQAKEDYEGYEFQLTFADGEFVKYIDVSALNDSEYEEDKFGNFAIVECIGGKLSSISNTFSLALKDDDASDMRESTIGFTSDKVTVSKDKNSIKVEVKREGDLRYTASVHYATEDNTAKAGTNYTNTEGEIVFMPGNELGYFEIPLISSGKKNIDFKVTLSDIKGGKGKCKLGKSELKVIIPTGLTALKSQTNGIVGAGNNLQSMLAMSNGEDLSTNMITDEESLLHDSDDELDIEEALESEALYADIVESANGGTPNTHDYAYIHFERDDNYIYDTRYWKEYEMPYYNGDEREKNFDVVNYALSTPTFVKHKLLKESFVRKKEGVGTLQSNYHTQTPAEIKIPHAGFLFETISYNITVEKCAVCRRALIWLYNYTMPWTIITVTQKGQENPWEKDYYKNSNFGPQDDHNNPLRWWKEENTIDLKFADSTFDLTLNTTLNNLDVQAEPPAGSPYVYVPGDKTSISLRNLSMRRREFYQSANIALRIYTSNDVDTGNDVVNDNVYKSIEPKVSLVKKESGIGNNGNLYVGSKLCVELPSSVSFKPLSRQNADETVFVTTLDGTKVPVKVEKASDYKYYITFLWENMTVDDLDKQFRINVVYERNQKINLDISPSLIRDDKGNQKTDKDSIMKSWDEALKDNTQATITYSVYDPTNSYAKGGYVTKTVKKKITELFGTEAKKIRTLQDTTNRIVNVQTINFGLLPEDVILFNGETYKGNETIELKADELTIENLYFNIYKEKYLSLESKMNINISNIELYFDGNGNGKIDGYYDESAGVFMLDEKSGDVFCGAVKDKIPESGIEPKLNAKGEVLQYFFKTYYNITPRALMSDKQDTAQILPCFIPQDTNEDALANLSEEQRAYRMVKTTGTSILPYDKKSDKTGKKYDVPDTAEGHLMYGAEASKRSSIDFPLGGDMRAYVGGKVNGKEIDINDYCGNLRFNFDNTENLLVKGTSGSMEQISDVNGYVGSFLNNTSFICGVQQTKELKSNDDFVPENIANSNVYAMPANSTSSSLGGLNSATAPTNIGSGKLEQTKPGDFNADLTMPTFSFSGLGLDVKFFNGNALMITFGIPLNLINKTYPASSKETIKNEDGTTDKIVEKKEENKKISESQKLDEKGNELKREKTVDEENKEADGDTSFSRYSKKSEGDIEKSRIEIIEKDKDGNEKSRYENEKEIPLDDDSSKSNDSLDNKMNNDTSMSKYLKDTALGTFGIDKVIKFIDKWRSNSFAKERENVKAGKNNKTTTVVLDLVISAYVVLKYNALDGRWQPSSAAASIGGAFSFSWKYRFAPIPFAYFFVNVNISLSSEFNWSFKREYDVIGTILGNSTVLSDKVPYKFELDTSSNVGGLRLDFKGEMLITVSKSGESKPLMKGRISSNGKKPIDLRIRQHGKLDIDIRAASNTALTVNNIKTVGTTIKSVYEGVTLYGEAGFNVGFGAGMDPSLLSGEVFLKGGGKFTAALNKENAGTFLQDFALSIAITVRAKLILFNFTFDFVGVKYTGKRSKEGEPMQYQTYFTVFDKTWPKKNGENSDGAIEVLEPQSSAENQQIFRGISDPNSAENAFHPTDESVKFELSGYGTSGDALKLADRLDSGYQSEAFVMNDETYLLYMISDPASEDNGINASRLALSKIVTNAEPDKTGLENPINENSTTPYIFVDSQDMGNLAFTYKVNGTKLDVTYIGYNKHFDEDNLTTEDARKHIVIKQASIDIEGEGVTGFDESKVISETAGIYRFNPAVGQNATYYAETISNKGDQDRLDNMRAFLKAAYGVNEEDYTAKEPEASKLQNIYRYKVYESNNTLNGDGSQIIAVNKDGERVVVPVGQNSGEVISELKVQNIDDTDVLVYLTSQEAYFDTNGNTLSKDQFNADTDYAIINRMYARSFDGNNWSEPIILSQAVDFEKCSEQNIETYQLTDGLYSGGSLQTAFANPSISNINFLLANLDGNGIKPILTVELNGNTMLLDNNAIQNIIKGEQYEAKPIFNSELGTSVQITTDAEGNLLLGFIKTVDETENNAVYCAWWDKQAGTWGEANILAMNHMSVYENIYKYSLDEKQAQKAYLGETTGNEAYDKAVEEGKVSKGACDRFEFKDIQLLPTKTKVRYAEDEAQTKITTETRDGLMLLCKGNYYELEKQTGQLNGGETSEPFEYFTVKNDYGTGFYAVPFGVGDASIGEESITLNNQDFSCGSVISGTLYFTNTGTTAIRGSKDQPIKLQLIAENKEEGLKQVIGDYCINDMIVSGQKVSYEFTTKELQSDLPENTEFKIFVSEDEEYVRTSGGVAFSRLSDSVFTVKQISDVNIENMNYEIIGIEDDSIYIETDFVVANHGSQDAENLVMQYSVAEKEDSETSKPIDITGTELYVDREIKITNINANDATDVTDLSRGVIALKDREGNSNLRAGYMRSVIGVLKVKKTDFERFSKDGMFLRAEVFSDADSYVVSNDIEDVMYTKIDSTEYSPADSKANAFISQKTEFNVPGNIHMNLNNTLRVPISYNSTATQNDIVVREISNGEDDWVSRFNDLHYDQEHNTIVAVAKMTGNTVIQIENRATNTIQNMVVDIENNGFGVNIFNDDDSFKFYNKNGQQITSESESSDWKFHSDVKSWKGENEPPMANNICIAEEGASVKFTTVATTVNVFFKGKIKVTSDKFSKSFELDNTDIKSGSYVAARFDNLEGIQHTITITSLADDTEIDRYTASYPEEGGITIRKNDYSPMIYWARSFPNTASIREGKGNAKINCYFADESELASVKFNGEDITDDVTRHSNRLWSFEFTFKENGEYVLEITDAEGNVTIQKIKVYWFNSILNRDAIPDAPAFELEDTNLIDEKGKTVGENDRSDTLKIGVKYDTQYSHFGEEFTAYSCFNQNFDKKGTEQKITDQGERQYQRIVDAPINGFYIIRDVAQNGTWSIAMLDVHQNSKVKPTYSMKLVSTSKTENYLQIDYDATTSGISHIPTIKVNGYKLPVESFDDGRCSLRFDVDYSGEYNATFFDGYETYSLSENIKLPLYTEGDIPYELAYNTWLEKWKFVIDPSNIRGQYYDKAISDTEHNKYVSSNLLYYQYDSKEYKVNWVLASPNSTTDVKIYKSPETIDDYIPLTLTAPEAPKSTISGNPFVGNNVFVKLPEGVDEKDAQFQWMRLNYRTGDTKVYSELVDIEGANQVYYRLNKEDEFRLIYCKVTYNGKSEIIKMPLLVIPSFKEGYKLTYNGEKQALDYMSVIEYFAGEDEVALKIICEELEKEIGEEMSLSGNEATDVGDYVCKVSFKDNPEFDFDFNWSIVPADISEATITVDRMVYNGKEQICIPKVTLEGFDQVDYDITGNKATAPGVYVMTITGKGNFTGKVKVKWAISEEMPQTGAKAEFVIVWLVLLLSSLLIIVNLLYRKKYKK